VSRPALGPTQPPVQWVPGVLSPGVKRGRGVTLTTHPHLVPRSRMSGSYISSPPSALMTCSVIAFIDIMAKGVLCVFITTLWIPMWLQNVNGMRARFTVVATHRVEHNRNFPAHVYRIPSNKNQNKYMVAHYLYLLWREK
jgi:hypothetical protein